MIASNARKLFRIELLYICVGNLVGKIEKVYPPFDLSDYQQYLNSFNENEYIYHSDQSYIKNYRSFFRTPFQLREMFESTLIQNQ